MHDDEASVYEDQEESPVLEDKVFNLAEEWNTSFFTAKIAMEVEVSFDQMVWKKCRATQKYRQFSDKRWRNEVIRGLNRAYSVCSFAFRRHWASLSNGDSRKEVLFTCQGRCTFKSCKVTFVSHVDKNLQLHVK